MASALRSRSSRSLRDFADDPDAEARSGERLASDDLLRQAQLGADRPDLVLEQRAQRFDQFELQVLRQSAHVVVALDVRRALAAAGFDDVRVQRSLHQELDLLAVRGRLGEIASSASSKARMNSRPMILRLVSGSLTPASADWKRSCSLAT